MKKSLFTIFALGIMPISVVAESIGEAIEIGAVLNGRYQENERVFGNRGEGFSIGHSEINLSANIDDKFKGVMTTVIDTHNNETELELEEAYISTIGLGGGLTISAGRQLSGFGYLNSRHLHEDDFADRPGVYRAYLGNHYFDDGIAASVVLPTTQYFKFGLEAFDGSKMAAEGIHDEDMDTLNVFTGQIKTGADINDSNSWQLGLSYLNNRSGMQIADAHSHEHGHGHEEEHDAHHSHGHGNHDHGHSHSAAVTGKNLYGIDFTWKWAPDGNYKNQNLILSAEYLMLEDLLDETLMTAPGAPDSLSGWYLSGAYQFSPQWTLGLRYGQVETYHGHGIEIHGDHAHGNYDIDELKEADLSLAWHPSHFSKIRATVTQQENIRHGTSDDTNIFVLEYVMSLGAHGAHKF